MSLDQKTIAKVGKYYNEYRHITGLRILKDGKWTYKFGPLPKGNIDGVKAEQIQLSQCMSFTAYLERFHGRKTARQKT